MTMFLKRVYFFFFVGTIISLLCNSGCDFVYRILQREGAEEKDLLGEVIPFNYNSQVEKVQRFLKLYGYNPGKADGKFGPKTRSAIEAFQQGEGLKVTRFVDKKTWAKLSLWESVGLTKEGEIDYKAVQTALYNAGFDPGKIDGLFGTKTISALKEFQQSLGLKADGVIGPKTLRSLQDYLLAQ